MSKQQVKVGTADEAEDSPDVVFLSCDESAKVAHS